MPLTAAQKQKNYRQRMRAENPEKYEIAKKKNAERNKKRKKITDYGEEEKAKERKKWRDRKKKQSGKTCNENEASTSKNERNSNSNGLDNVDVIQKARLAERRKNERFWTFAQIKYENKIKQLRKTIKTLQKKVNRCQKNNEKLTQTIEEMKKDNIKIRQEPSNEVENETTPKYMTPVTKSESFIEKNLPDIPPEHKETVKKQLLNHNILLDSLQNTYEKAKTNTERNILKSVIDNDIVRKYKSTTLMARYLGLKGKIRRSRDRKARNNKTLNELRLFYERDDVSRATAGKKEYRTFKKIKQQIRYLLGTLRDLYKKYRAEGGKLKYSMFKKCRPFYVLPPKITNRETCGCMKHENVMMKCNMIKALGMIQTNNIVEITSEIVCDTNAKDCAYGDCIACKNKYVKLSWEGKDSTEIVSWQEWNLVKHEYKEKRDNPKVTKRMVKNRKSGTLKDLIDLFNKELQKFKKHLYNIKHQYKQYSTCLKNLTDKDIAIHIDFSENWICKLATEVQAMHFGASQTQITIHTGVLYSKDNIPKTFATISPSNEHGPEAIWAHLAPILELVNIQYPKVTRIHFFSDGPTSQYRQKKNFYYFSKITKEMGFISSTWNFSESSHGKGAADGVGAAVKRKLDSCVSHGVGIPDALTAFNVLHEANMAIMLYYIPQADINNYETPANLKPVPGTMQLHQITNTEMDNVIQYRSLSCFCSMSIHSGYCKCLDLKSHLLMSSYENDPEKDFKINDDKKTVSTDLKIKKHQVKAIYRKTDEEITGKRDLKRKTQQKPMTKTFKRRKREGSTSESSTENEEEPVITYVETDDDDIDATFYTENSSPESSKSQDNTQFILDEYTGLLLNKTDVENLQQTAESYENKTRNEFKEKEFVLNQSKVCILNDLTIAADKYVLVKFDTSNKTIKHYIGKVLEMNGVNVKISFMRKKTNGTFYWPQIQDVSDMFSIDIIKVLHSPIRCRRGILEFGDNLSEYKIY